MGHAPLGEHHLWINSTSSEWSLQFQLGEELTHGYQVIHMIEALAWVPEGLPQVPEGLSRVPEGLAWVPEGLLSLHHHSSFFPQPPLP